jgi:hypothetical protein
LIPRPGRTVCKAPEPRVEIYILFEPGRPHRKAPVPPIKFPVVLNPEIDETVSDDIRLFEPYASICPVLIEFVVKEETANWGVLIVVAVRLPIVAESQARVFVDSPRIIFTVPSNKFKRALFVATIFGVLTAYWTT